MLNADSRVTGKTKGTKNKMPCSKTRKKIEVKPKKKVSQSLLPVTLAKRATLVYTCCMRSQPKVWHFPNRLTHAPDSVIAFRR